MYDNYQQNKTPRGRRFKMGKGNSVSTLELNEQDLTIKVGINHSQIEQLIDYANTDKLIQRFTSDPRRFRDRKAFEKWGEKGRSIYTLADTNGRLLGIVWLGQEAMPGKEFIADFDPGKYGVTFTIRVYGSARGKRLARKFMEECLKHYLGTDDYQALPSRGIWLEVTNDNIPALKIYRQVGFKQVSRPDEGNRILMIYPPSAD